MRHRTLRCLILACSLNLVLPPGWCCIFQAQASPPASKEATSQPSSCCGHCKAKSRSVPARSTDPVAPAPDPVTPGQCPCTERYTTPPSAPKTIACDLGLPLLLPPVHLVSCDSAPADRSEAPALHADPPLQILYCTWLC